MIHLAANVAKPLVKVAEDLVGSATQSTQVLGNQGKTPFGNVLSKQIEALKQVTKS